MRLLPILCLLAVASCHRENPASDADAGLQPKNADTETCAACGMVIREQPAPRGQVIHRNGDRRFLCSIDDLLQYLEVPSPSGKPARIYSEVMPEAHALEDMDTSFQSWEEAAALFYVTGIDRQGVMGAPVMSYQSKEAADKAAENFGGKVLTFEQLRKQIQK